MSPKFPPAESRYEVWASGPGFMEPRLITSCGVKSHGDLATAEAAAIERADDLEAEYRAKSKSADFRASVATVVKVTVTRKEVPR